MKSKDQLMFKVFVLMALLIFIYFIADMSFSYLNICQLVRDQVYCKPIPVIDLFPML